MIEYHIYPGGTTRIVTFSYDDGHANDRRLIDLFNRYGMKGTFHLNSMHYKGLSDEELKEIHDLYEGHEIACHTVHHGYTDRMPLQSVLKETLEDRMFLEKIAGYPVVGMSYPCGIYTEECIQAMESCGIVYSRTTANHGKCWLPERFMVWNPTCHHRDGLRLAEHFMSMLDSKWISPLFYCWGHSHELKTEEDWTYMESIVRTLAGCDKIWYATNLQIYEYLTAQKQLRISVDEKIFTNPAGLDIWVIKDESQVICVPAGKTICID